MTNDRLKRYAAIAGLLAVPLLVPALLHDSFSRVSASTDCAKVAAVFDSAGFSVDGLVKKSGTPVSTGERFSRIEGGVLCEGYDSPLSARGRTELPDTTRVWAVLSGGRGQFYLQHPPVEILAGRWVAANLRPGRQIARIQFFEVDAGADNVFRERAERRDWSEFSELPAGARELASLKLE